MADRRLVPARPDLAASFLKGKVEAGRFVEGVVAQVSRPRAWLRTGPRDDAAQASELLLGEEVSVYERQGGWAWVQAGADAYVGYVKESALGPVMPTDARVILPLTPLLAAADVKSALMALLPRNARVKRGRPAGAFVEAAGGFVAARALGSPEQAAPDFVAAAEAFLGAPYVWGGKSFDGLDCSGLIQLALQAANIACPRDTDMMEQALGQPVERDALRRGDLVFWKGHMGVMRDQQTLLHANAFFMQVTSEPLATAIARIQKPVTAFKRL